MKLRFSLEYITEWGENLYVAVWYVCGDGSVKRNEFPMTTLDGLKWTAEAVVMDSRLHPISSFSYAYQVENADREVLRREWDLIPRVFAFDSTYNYDMLDSWRDIPLQQHLYTKARLATVHSALDEKVKPLVMPLFRKTIMFTVSAPQLVAGQVLALCGSHPALGNWNPSRYLKMRYAGQSVWRLSVNAMGIPFPVEYKYVVVDEKNGEQIAWEEGENRIVDNDDISSGLVTVTDGGVLRVCETMWRAAGVVVPVASLRTDHSYGVGDFGDLRRMVDWAVLTGMKIIQVLPVNDTGISRCWTDSCPYNIMSVYALHPHYVDLEAAGEFEDKSMQTMFHRQRRELNALCHSDYEAVDRVKSAYLRCLYSTKGKRVVKSHEFLSFVADNASWLPAYAVFMCLADEYGTAHFHSWGDYATYNEGSVGRYVESHKDSVTYIYYVQYLLHCQLKAASDYAHSQGVALKADIPCGVGRCSVDVWMNPDLFDTSMQTGTQPDANTPLGQNWGFPAYNWDVMMADGCLWWRKRLAHIEQYFDAFRMDHVLGMFRIWEMSENDVYGLLGHFSPALPFSSDEIEHVGLHFRKDFYTTPFINDNVLDKIFGMHAQFVRDNFLENKAYNMYGMKPEYDNQKKIRAAFDGKNDENSIWIRDGLYRLIENVLFVEDPRLPGMYHPRINAYRETIFEALNNNDKDAFMHLYNQYFYQRHNMLWGWQAVRRLTMILNDTRMLVCAEDLGSLPVCVENVIDTLRILSLDIQTMPKQSGLEFGHLNANPYRSVATLSTHDMPSLRLWWEESPERTQRYFTTMLQKEGRAPACLPAHLAEEIVARHLYCPSMLCLLSIQDWLAVDAELRPADIRSERINVPGDSYNRWEYRMPVTIERLLQEDRFNGKLKTLITRSRR